jgi:hypothetical protein
MTATVFTAAVAELGMAPATAMVTATAMAMDVAPATAMVTATAMDMATDMAMATEMGMVAATASATDMAVYRVATERSNKQTTTNCNTFKTMIESKPKSHPHAHWIKLWADGVPIEYKAGGKWIKVIEFNTMTMPDIEYRIKPEENEPWNPKENEMIYYVNQICEVSNFYWADEAKCCKLMRDAGNCFRTKEEAEAAIPRVKDALKGSTDVSANVGSNVGSPEIDGKSLTDGEKALIRAMRLANVSDVHGRGSILVVIDANGLRALYSTVAFSTAGNSALDETIRAALKQIKEEKEAWK